MNFFLSKVGAVSYEELVARFSAYLNAGAPEPILNGTPEENHAALDRLAADGDSQMRTFVDDYRRRIDPITPETHRGGRA